MIYYTYGRRRVEDRWEHPIGVLSDGSLCGIEYMANYYGTLTSGSIEVVADYDPTEISKEMFDAAYAAYMETSGSL